MSEKNKIIVILGPTASGKSDIAVKLAKRFNGEIISADSRQVYKGLDIGTGKITRKEMKGVRHYLLDVVSLNRLRSGQAKQFTASEFVEKTNKTIVQIVRKNKVPIICGGTGFYIDALLGDKQIPEVPPNLKLREKLEKKPAGELFEILKRLDPGRAGNIDAKNPRRLVRAIEICKALGKVPKQISNFKSQISNQFQIIKIGIKVEDEELKKRINERIEKWFKQGILKEVRNLRSLKCPKAVAETLSLQEDVQVFALDDRGNNVENGNVSALRNPQNSRQNSQPSATVVSPIQQIGADIVQAAGNTGSGRKVVVLDTGYNRSHPELSSSYLGGWDFVNNDGDPVDDNGHGSHVAGIITADGIADPNDKGVAPGTGIIAGKVLDNNGTGYFSDVRAAIYWAVDGPDGLPDSGDEFNADAINLSLGTGAPYLYKNFCDNFLPDLTTAIKYARDRGIVVVVAAGNSGSRGVSVPGCISYSTTVGAVDNKDAVASFSGRGNALDITSPGVNIYSTVLGSAYATWSGTSMATPMVSGVVALIKKAYPSYTQSQVESKLFTTAKDLGSRGKDTSYGYGRVNAAGAVK